MVLDSAAKGELAEAIQKAQEGALVQGVHKIFEVLTRHKLCRVQKIEPVFIGVHPANRDGFGVSPQDTHELIRSIVHVGWDNSQIKAICCEIASDDDVTAMFNSRLSEMSAGMIPAIPRQYLRYASLSASHTNAALRCIAAGVAHSDEKLTIGGKLAVERLAQVDAQFAQAAQEGIQWQIVALEAVQAFPQLPSLIQASSNSAGQLATHEHEMQMLRRIDNAVAASKMSGSVMDYPQLKEKLLKSRPSCASAMPFMFRFITKFCTGAPGSLHRIESFVKLAATSGRQLGGEFFEGLSMDARPPQSNSCLFFRHALLAVAYTVAAPKLILPADTKKLMNKDAKIKIEKANELLKKVRELEELKVPQNPSLARYFLAFETDLVLLALEKRHRDIKLSPTMESAAFKLCQDVQKECGVTLSTEWDSFQESAAQPSSSNAAPQTVQLPSCKCAAVYFLFVWEVLVKGLRS